MGFVLEIRKYFKRKWSKLKEYLLSDNPLIQYFYFFIVTFTYGGFFVDVYIMRFNQISPLFMFIGNVLAWLSFYNYYQAWKSDAGVINEKNWKEYEKKYEKYYDGFAFVAKKKCRTCLFNKPARSKHCKLCDHCVSVFDHHCPWIRNCVGEKNKNYFSRFLFYSCLALTFEGLFGVYLIVIRFYKNYL